MTLEELTTKLKKSRKKIKKLETSIETVQNENAHLKERLALIEGEIKAMDTRTSRMGIALYECMKKLGIARPK